jgi:membrane protease YdiL (CAAX protease family)
MTAADAGPGTGASPAAAPSARRLTLVSLLFYGALAAGSVVALFWRGHAEALAPDPGSRLAQLGLAEPGLTDLVALELALGLLLGVGIAGASQAFGEGTEALRFLSERLRELLRGLTPGQALLLAVSSGVGEELLFRGVLFEELLPRIGASGTLAATSLAFGFAHAGWDRRFLAWTALSFAIGALLGALRLFTGGLVAPIALHVSINALNLLVEAWDQRAERPRRSAGAAC